MQAGCDRRKESLLREGPDPGGHGWALRWERTVSGLVPLERPCPALLTVSPSAGDGVGNVSIPTDGGPALAGG